MSFAKKVQLITWFPRIHFGIKKWGGLYNGIFWFSVSFLFWEIRVWK